MSLVVTCTDLISNILLFCLNFEDKNFAQLYLINHQFYNILKSSEFKKTVYRYYKQQKLKFRYNIFENNSVYFAQDQISHCIRNNKLCYIVSQSRDFIIESFLNDSNKYTTKQLTRALNVLYYFYSSQDNGINNMYKYITRGKPEGSKSFICYLSVNHNKIDENLFTVFVDFFISKNGYKILYEFYLYTKNKKCVENNIIRILRKLGKLNVFFFIIKKWLTHYYSKKSIIMQMANLITEKNYLLFINSISCIETTNIEKQHKNGALWLVELYYIINNSCIDTCILNNIIIDTLNNIFDNIVKKRKLIKKCLEIWIENEQYNSIESSFTKNFIFTKKFFDHLKLSKKNYTLVENFISTSCFIDKNYYLNKIHLNNKINTNIENVTDAAKITLIILEVYKKIEK